MDKMDKMEQDKTHPPRDPIPITTNFTQSEMLRYYVIQTDYICTHCCELAASVLSPQIMVEYVTARAKRNAKANGANSGTKSSAATPGMTSNATSSLPLSNIIDRYIKLPNHTLTHDEAFHRLPKLPFEIKTFEQEITFCQNCIPKTLGTDAANAFPAMLPAPFSQIHENYFSENLPDPAQDKRPPQKKSKTHRKARPGREPENAKQRHLNKLKVRPMDELF